MMTVNGIIFILLGLSAIVFPVSALLTVVLYIGIAALLAGIVSVVYAFSNTAVKGWGWRLMEGIADLIIAGILLSNPVTNAMFVPMLIGIWIFLRGATYLFDSFSWRNSNRSNWGGYGIAGVALLVLGFYMMIDWQMSFLPAALVVAVTFLTLGIGSLIIGRGHK